MGKPGTGAQGSRAHKALGRTLGTEGSKVVGAW